MIAADLRNAKGGEVLQVRSRPTGRGTRLYRRSDRTDGSPWRHVHQQFLVLGFCIGGPFIWNMLLKRAVDRVIAAVPAQPSGWRPEMPTLSYDNNMKGWGPELCARRPDITMAMVDAFLTNMYSARADFVYTVPRDFRARLSNIDPGIAGRRAGASICRLPWKPCILRRTRK